MSDHSSLTPGSRPRNADEARASVDPASHQHLSPVQEAQLLAVLTGTLFVTVTGINMLAPVLLELASDFNSSVGAVGQLAAAAAVPWALLAPFMGVLSDRYGRRPVLSMGLVVLGLSTIASAFAWDYTSMMVFRVLGGIGGATTGPNAMAAPADYFPPNRRGRAMGFILAGLSLSTVVGTPLVAVVAAYAGWRWSFAGVGVLLVLLSAAVWLVLPRKQRGKPQVGYLSGLTAVLKSHPTALLLVANLLERASFVSATIYLPAFLIQSYSLGLEQVAPVLSAIAAGTLLGSIFGGRLADTGRQRVQYSALLVVTALLVYPLFAATPGLLLTSAIAAVFGIAGSLARPAWLWMLTKVPAEVRGATTGFAATSNQIGIVVGSSVGGILVGSGNYAAVGLFAAIAALASAAVCTLSRPVMSDE